LKKVLIISYYFPPSGGSGVQRVLKFVKYLPQFGWKPVVYTVKNGEYPIIDESLEKDVPDEAEVIRTKIWEPYNLYKKFTGAPGDSAISPGFVHENKKPKLTQRISQWIRGNVFIPDARKFWIKPSIKFLVNYLKQNPVDAIISSGPPHSCHLIALGLKKRLGIKWIADLRDPWTKIYYYEKLHHTKSSHEKNLKLEKEVLTQADEVIVVGETMKKEFSYSGKNNIHVITNGYDEDDIILEKKILDEKFSIVYTGYLVGDENSTSLWQALKTIINSNNDFRAKLHLKFVGKVDVKVKNEITSFGLDKYSEFIDYKPHDEVISYQQSAQVLLLLLNDTQVFRGILTGKLFEYLAAKRPILCIGSVDGDAAKIINETQSGVVLRNDDENGIKEKILEFFEKYKSDNLHVNSIGIEKYSRRNLTSELVRILNK
jgi:hypothetical protein